MSAKFNAYLQLARISNLPTVFSNVLVGAAVWAGPVSLEWILILGVVVSVSLFYVGGMALNDLWDRRVDRIERPHRPIPAGTLSEDDVRNIVAISFVGGMLILALWIRSAILPGLGLITSIALYNYLHKRWSASLVFMGLCRALVYIVGASAVAPKLNKYLEETENYDAIFSASWALIICAALLAIYIIALTFVAQKEVSGGLGFRRWLGAALVLIPLPAFYLIPVIDWRWTAPAVIILALWLVRSARFVWQSPPKVVPAVLGWLAGISLLDAFFLTFTPFPWLSLIALACFAVTVWGHRRIAGT